MNYEVRAIFYRGDEPKGDDQGFTVAKFEAESVEAARASAEAGVESYPVPFARFSECIGSFAGAGLRDRQTGGV